MLSHLFGRFKHVPLALALLLTLCAMSFLVHQVHAVPTGRLANSHLALPQIDTLHCSNPGGFLQSYPAYIAGTTTQIGALDLYYNSSTGYNCAYMRSVGPAYGQAQQIAVTLYDCQQTSSGPSCTPISSAAPYYDHDGGNYQYYAGPVGVKGKGHCVYADGYLIWNNQWSTTASTGGASHCG
jgi:hypothetical protein